MSEATLTNLLEYLYETLTPSDKRWVGERLIKYANYEEEPVKPYTMEEINARIDQSERDSAEGKVYDFDDVMREIEEEFAFEEKLEMAEAVWKWWWQILREPKKQAEQVKWQYTNTKTNAKDRQKERRHKKLTIWALRSYSLDCKSSKFHVAGISQRRVRVNKAWTVFCLYATKVC